MKTSFKFDFQIDFALALPDSVLAFHKHGVQVNFFCVKIFLKKILFQGRSFFRGAVTQDLYDPSKIYEVIGSDS